MRALYLFLAAWAPSLRNWSVGILAFLAGAHLVNQGQVPALTNALSLFGTGIMDILSALGILWPAVAGILAQLSASKKDATIQDLNKELKQ